jgi:site-specific recombinase XerD
MVSVLFVYRPLSGKGGGGSLYVRIIGRRQVRQWSLNCRLKASEWDAARQQIIMPRFNTARQEFLSEVSEKMAHTSATLRLVEEELERSGQPFGIKEIQEAFLLRESGNSLRAYAEQLEAEKKQDEKNRTARAYRGAVDALTRFHGSELQLDHLTPSLLKNFEISMQKADLCANTTSQYMRSLQAVCNKAHDDGYKLRLPSDLFAGVFTGVAQTKKRALPVDSLSRLFSLDLEQLIENEAPGSRIRQYLEGLFVAWRLFFFSFHTAGMCFVDMAHLKKENISEGQIIYRRRKTGQEIAIELTPQIQYVIDSFAADTAGSPYVFPLLREDSDTPLYRQYESALRTYNRRLKRLSVMAGLDSSPLSSHVARHSWATIGKDKSLSMTVLGSMLGHTTEKTTKVYLASFDRAILAAANRLITKDFIAPAQRRAIATG